MARRFWSMSTAEIEEYIAEYGLPEWKSKIAEDNMHAADELAQEDNPWLEESHDVRRQRIIEELAPELAEMMKTEAGSGEG